MNTARTVTCTLVLVWALRRLKTFLVSTYFIDPEVFIPKCGPVVRFYERGWNHSPATARVPKSITEEPGMIKIIKAPLPLA